MIKISNKNDRLFSCSIIPVVVMAVVAIDKNEFKFQDNLNIENVLLVSVIVSVTVAGAAVDVASAAVFKKIYYIVKLCFLAAACS